jgi:nucleoside-diphosphate-sugar epimerase
VTSGSVPADGSIAWHRADLLDDHDRRTLVAGVRADALVHLAWCAKPPAYWRDPDNLRWVGATLELVRAFASCGGTRVVGAGTCAEYDWRYGLCTEGLTPVNAATLYGASKAACGAVLDAYGRDAGISAAWARLFFLFGPHDSAVRLIPSLVASLSAGEPARCTAGGHYRDFLPVEDAAAAIVALLQTDVTGPVNVGSGTPRSVASMARAVASCLGRETLLTVDEAVSEAPLVTASIERLHREVGWRPTREFAAALESTVRWWASAQAREASA